MKKYIAGAAVGALMMLFALAANGFRAQIRDQAFTPEE